MSLKTIYPALAGVFTFLVLALANQYMVLLFPVLAVSLWLWPVLLLSALESAYFAAFFLDSRTPAFVRLLELGPWLLPLYFVSGGLNYKLLWTGFLTFLTWLLARDYGYQTVLMARIAPYVGDQSARTVTWEYEALADKDFSKLSIEFFWWRLFSFGLLLTILAIAVNRSGIEPSRQMLWRLAFLGKAAIISGLGLQGVAYLLRLQILWKHTGAQVDVDLFRIWFRNFIILVLLLTIVISLAPINYSPITANKVGKALGTIFSSLPVFKYSPTESDEMLPVPQEPDDFTQAQQPGLISIGYLLSTLIYLVFAGILIVLILGLIVFSAVEGELDKLRGLPLLVAKIYQVFRNMFSKLQNLRLRFSPRPEKLEQTIDNVQEQKGKRKDRFGKFRPFGVRALFRQIMVVAERRGLKYVPAQTPLEFAQDLKKKLPENDDLEPFFHGYHQVRYGEEDLTKIEEKTVLAAGGRIVKQLKAWDKED